MPAVRPTLAGSALLQYRDSVRDLDEDNDLTGDHMRVLQWLDVHPLGTSAAEMAHALDLESDEVDALCADLIAAGMIDDVRLH